MAKRNPESPRVTVRVILDIFLLKMRIKGPSISIVPNNYRIYTLGNIGMLEASGTLLWVLALALTLHIPVDCS